MGRRRVLVESIHHVIIQICKYSIWGASEPRANSDRCLYLFGTTLFHLSNGKCDFYQNNGSLAQMLSGFLYELSQSQLSTPCETSTATTPLAKPDQKMSQKDVVDFSRAVNKCFLYHSIFLLLTKSTHSKQHPPPPRLISKQLTSYINESQRLASSRETQKKGAKDVSWVVISFFLIHFLINENCTF